ncbi:MAG: tetratricopeptide repeat protein [Thermoanaerobaculaceae bacterium]|nr:tetratricopeptide repeat protein [Thermoanaerobaculaceae bacterium]
MFKKLFLSIFFVIFILPVFSESLHKASERARVSYEKGNFEEAAKIYKDLVAKAKDEKIKAILCFNLATTLYKMGDFSSSVQFFYEGLNNIPLELKPRMLYNLGHSLFKSGRRDEALSVLRDAITLKQDYEEAKLLYEWILKQKPPEPPPPEDNQEPPPPPPMMEELPPPPPEILQDELENIENPTMKPW